MNDSNNNFFNLLNLASLIVGVQNLNENHQQSAHNDIQAENEKQAEFLLGEINREFGELKRLFEKQNETLQQIVGALNKIQEMESAKNED